MTIFPSKIVIVLLVINTGLGALFLNLHPLFITLKCHKRIRICLSHEFLCHSLFVNVGGSLQWYSS